VGEAWGWGWEFEVRWVEVWGGKLGGGEGWLVCGSVGGLVVIEVDFGVDCRLDADGLAGLCWVRCCC